MKCFLTGKKFPCIPSIFHQNRFITDFRGKAELFNSSFANQCSSVQNSSVLPTDFELFRDKSFSNIIFTDNDVGRIISSLDPNKAHGHDMMSIRLLKICGNSINKPLGLIFRACLEHGIFSQIWKKANVVPIHKKNDKQSIRNYRPVSLLPICGNIFERLLYNNMFSFLIENDLVSENQSGFKPSDSCVNHLLSITYEICKSFDDKWEVRGVFLDISKAFDKVWHQGVILKLKQNCISGNLLKIIEDFLSNRYQRVVLNGQSSGWAAVNAGVPQGSILGRLLFLIYINDLSTGLSSNPRLFADDTSLFRNTSANELNNDLLKIRSWSYQWKMSFNPDPSKQAQEVIFSRNIKKPNHPELIFNNIPVNQTSYQKHLGMFLDNKLNFGEHLKYITNKVNKSIVLLCKLQMILPRRSLVTIYKSFIRPHLDYDGIIFFDQAFN